MTRTTRLGAWSGAWGDSRVAMRQLLESAELDYVIGDYLAEVTMALLARVRAKDPESGGYIAEAVETIIPLLSDLDTRRIKVVTNAGALNPAGAARALREAIDSVGGLNLRVAAVLGDDLTMRVDQLRSGGLLDMFTGEAIPDSVLTSNAYLGAFPIAEALAAGADIVITGRCADSAMALGALIHEFGWNDDDHDLLSAGTLIGHLVECGPQGVGGLFSDWASVPGWEDMGYPVVECRADGTAVITKPENTGGLVVPGSVGEQMLYEIGDPGAYVVPDVVCDWRDVRLEQDGPNRVLIGGAQGRAATDTYKTTVTVPDGFRVLSTAMFAGHEAASRARRAGEAILNRAERIAIAEGLGAFTERSIEVAGAGDTLGTVGAFPAGREAVLKVGARHPDRRALEIFATEMVSMAFVAQGMTGLAGGRPKPAPCIRLVHVLVPKTDVPVQVKLDDETLEVDVAVGAAGPVHASPPLAEDLIEPGGETITVPLHRVAWARSGDKGNNANIGILARHPELVSTLHEQVTAERIRAWFGTWAQGPVTRWALPGTHSINVLIEDALGGQGGTSSLRYDPLAKSMAATLLDLPVTVPASWEAAGLLS